MMGIFFKMSENLTNPIKLWTSLVNDHSDYVHLIVPEIAEACQNDKDKKLENVHGQCCKSY